jgi:RNA recognition motif-containing protein
MDTLFVSALPFRVTEKQIRDLLAPFGSVQSVQLYADWDNASFEPYAHVVMQNPERAIDALDGAIINSTYLRLNKLVKLD